MVHPLSWPSNPIFFPIGVQPATSLTQDLSPEQSADILLLGCGDPRHILYTVSTDVTCPPVPRKLDITCCDLEPAVLARNILLYTLLEDNVPPNHMWDIFYHFRIGDHALGLIQSQSRKLVELSESPESWRESKSAASSWHEAIDPVSDQFAHYWEHGTTVTTSKEHKKTTKLNPTFFYSSLGESFDVYVHTFPQGYHFAPAFTPLVSDPAGPTTNSAMAKAKRQFKAGLTGLQMSRQASAIVLRFFVGDALALCRALDQFAKTQKTDIGEFTTPWRATTIDLSEHAASSPPAPRAFDVIDTSTLGHDLGIFNVLLLGQPLVKKRPASQAILYTDTPLAPDTSVIVFHEKICNSILTSGILIGLAPRPYLSIFTATSITHEIIMPRSNPVYIERIAWVDPASGDAHTYSDPGHTVPYFELKEHLQLLFGIYDIYFPHDRLTPDEISKLRQLKVDALQFFSTAHYSREFIVALMAHAKTRFCLTSKSGWDRLSELLLQVLSQHTQKPFLDLFHEMEVQHLLYSLPFAKLEAEIGDEVARSEVFKGWETPLPKLVCVVLIVPWTKLELLRQDRSSPSPKLVCNIINLNRGQPKKTLFESVQAAWGKCTLIEGSDGVHILNEGSAGFREDSGCDLVVSFWVLAEQLASVESNVSLNLLRTPLARYMYEKELGETLTLFSANVADKNHVLTRPIPENLVST